MSNVLGVIRSLNVFVVNTGTAKAKNDSFEDIFSLSIFFDIFGGYFCISINICGKLQINMTMPSASFTGYYVENISNI